MAEVFVDTSALFALVVADDRGHARAKAAFARLEAEPASLVSSSFVLQETTALLQARAGLASLRGFHLSLLPLIDVQWIDRDLYQVAMTALLAADRRRVSLTDWSSFEIMRRRGIERAFAFDGHFAEQGFKLIP